MHEKSSLDSARVPAPPTKGQGASKGSDTSGSGVTDAEDDDAEGDEGEAVKRSGSQPLEWCTMFVDGISASVDYNQIRALFAQLGRIRKVFVQRKCKARRRFRFGLVQLSRALAETEMARFMGPRLAIPTFL